MGTYADELPRKPIICPACKVECKKIVMRWLDRYECPQCGEVYALLDGEPALSKEH